jgi:hypothetical protein
LLKAIEASEICTNNERDDKFIFIDTYTAMSKYILKSALKGLSKNDNFLICDADEYYLTIKTMEITSGINRRKDAKESQNSITDMSLRGEHIDKRFEEYISELLSKHPNHIDSRKEDLIRVKEIMLQNFVENIKVCYS